MMEQRYTECCNYTRLVGQWGRLQRHLFASRYPWCPPPYTRYARYGGRYHGLLRGPPFGRLHYSYLTPRGLFNMPPSGHLPHLIPRFTLLTSNSSLKKNAAGAFCLGGRYFQMEWGITLGCCPTIRG